MICRRSGSQHASRFIQRRRLSFSSLFAPNLVTPRTTTILPPLPALVSTNASSSPVVFFQQRCFGQKTCGTDVKGSFPMPDQDTELKLAKIQTTISDHYKNGDFQAALKASKELLKQTQDHFGNKHPATASAHNNIGLMQKLLGDFVEARKNYNAAMRIYGQVVGRDHASYAMTLHNLGALNKSQVHFDQDLKATDRLSLVETALEYFEEAWAIRKAELGDDHPHTISTRSSYGSTLATQVLHQHKYVEKSIDGKEQSGQYVSLNPDQVTQQGWNAAEEHLRQALMTATSNPRGRQINSGNKRNKKGRNKNKKPQMKKDEKDASGPQIETLSAAAAAQGLAVFLKSQAMTQDPYNLQQLQESRDLYLQVQNVRSQLLPAQHPDLYATKHSYAELLEAMGDEMAANELRQEIIDTFDPPTEDDDDAPEHQQQQALSSPSSSSNNDTISTETEKKIPPLPNQ